jgi:hypothetical protein
MKPLLLAILILCLAMLACGVLTLMTPGDYVQEFGGDLSVYVEILELTDCTELQRDFEQANADVLVQVPGSQAHKTSVGYRTAAENRMKEVECVGDL